MAYKNSLNSKKLNYGVKSTSAQGPIMGGKTMAHQRAVLNLPITSDKTDFGPTSRWGNVQNHYETMNNKENFGGDTDDIDEISEFVDDNSKFEYTSDEESPVRSELGIHSMFKI
jgi:hypothetical protein